MDQSPDKSLRFDNVYGSPTVPSEEIKLEAIIQGKMDFAEFSETHGTFRSTGGTRKSKATKWNGQFTSKSWQACQAWNKGTEHNVDHLFDDGTCRFNHGCSKWWIDAADGNKCKFCLRDHKQKECDRPSSETSGATKPEKP